MYIATGFIWLLTVSLLYNGSIVTCQEPVASWTFNATNGGTDISTYGENSVSMNGITYGLGPNGEENGAANMPIPPSQYMKIVNPTSKLRFSTAMSFFTHRYVPASTKLGPIFEYYNSATGVIGTLLWLWGSTTTLKVENTGFNVGAASAITLDAWNKIVIVWESTQITFYVNGVLIQSTAGTLDLAQTSSGDIHFGSSPRSQTYHTGGRMACAKFFDVSLSPQQVGSLGCGIEVEERYAGIHSGGNCTLFRYDATNTRLIGIQKEENYVKVRCFRLCLQTSNCVGVYHVNSKCALDISGEGTDLDEIAWMYHSRVY